MYEVSYEELLRDILDEPILPIPPIGPNPFKVIRDLTHQKFLPKSERYVSPSPFGKVTFDYSNNDGSFFIGQGALSFEVRFSKSSDRSIHLLNDPISIKIIAIAKGVTEIEEIIDARIY